MKNLLQSYNLDDFEQLALLLQYLVCLYLPYKFSLQANMVTPNLNTQQQVVVSSGQVHYVRCTRQRVGDVARSLHSVRMVEW